MAENESTLLMMGWPEVPFQMSIVLYRSNKLAKSGHDLTVAGTEAALKLLKISDPEEHHVTRTIDREWCLADLVENQIEFVQCYAFMHSDASVTYAATISAISRAKRYAVIFRNNVKAFADGADFPGKKIVAEVVHNPKPLKNKIEVSSIKAKNVRWQGENFP